MGRTLLIAILFLSFGLIIGKLGAMPNQESLMQFLPTKEPERNLLIPDVAPTTPSQLYIRTAGGKKALRFSTTFYNQGNGPLEILGHTDDDKGITYASQYVYEEGGPGIYRDMGSFIFHPEHNHWHIDRYVYYQLWNLDGEGKANKMLRDTNKMSFCIWDEHPNDLSVENAPQRRVYSRTCNGRQQGMSIGWGDTYDASIEGQELDMTDIPDGKYIFRTIINPDRKLLETDYSNNVIDTMIEIKGTQIVRL